MALRIPTDTNSAATSPEDPHADIPLETGLEQILLACLLDMHACAALAWEKLCSADPKVFERFAVGPDSELPDFVWRAGVDFPDENPDMFWTTPSVVRMEGLFDDEDASAHLLMQRQADLASFTRLLDALASVAPIFSRSHARFSVQMEPMGQRMRIRAYCAGHAITTVEDSFAPSRVAHRLALVARALSTTSTPTGYWVVEPDHPPIPAASALEALLLPSVMRSAQPSIARVVAGVNMADLSIVGRLDTPLKPNRPCIGSSPDRDAHATPHRPTTPFFKDVSMQPHDGAPHLPIYGPYPFSNDGGWPEALADTSRPSVQTARAFVLLVDALHDALPIAEALCAASSRTGGSRDADSAVCVGQSQRHSAHRRGAIAYWPTAPEGDPPLLDQSLSLQAPSAHLALPQHAACTRILTGMERFLDLLAKAAPVFGRPWISMMVSVYRIPGAHSHPMLHATMFGRTPIPMQRDVQEKMDTPFVEQVRTASAGLVAVIDKACCLEAPTGFWRYLGTTPNDPMPAASPFEAAYLHELLHVERQIPSFGRWLRGPGAVSTPPLFAELPHPQPLERRLAWLQTRHPAA